MNERFREGMRLFGEKDYSGAEKIFREILSSDHTNHAAWNAIGVVFSKTDRYSLADEAFEQALLLNPGNITYEKNRDRNLIKIPSTEIQVPIVSYQDIEKCRKWHARGKYRFNLRKVLFIIFVTLGLCLLSGGIFAYSSTMAPGSASGTGEVEVKIANELGKLAMFTLVDRDKLVSTEILLNNRDPSSYFSFSPSSDQSAQQLIKNGLNIRVVGIYKDGSVKDAFNWTLQLIFTAIRGFCIDLNH